MRPRLPRRRSRDGALGKLFQIREEGFAKAVGLAAGRVEMMMPPLRDWDFEALMTYIRFTLVNRNAEEMLNFDQSRGIAALNAAPCASGALAKGSSAYPLRPTRRRAMPRRGDHCALRRTPGRGGIAVLDARSARDIDGVRRHQAGAGPRKRCMGALTDPSGDVG
jgi:aryl-alcohol dehydrogenase-like predicted oxidoreductase